MHFVDRQRLDLLRVSVADARWIIARSVDRIEETERILNWLRRLESPRIGFRPPPESE